GGTFPGMFRWRCWRLWSGCAHIFFCDPSSNPSGSRRIATGRAGGLSAPRPCWQTPAHRSLRLRSLWDSMARARSALPFIGSPGKHLPTIAATSNDARHDGAPAEAARRPPACPCRGRRTGRSPEATRRAFNKRFLDDLARDWEEHGPEVFKRVRPESPAAYLKVCAMLVPREMQIEHSGGVKAMSDEALENAIEALERM